MLSQMEMMKLRMRMRSNMSNQLLHQQSRIQLLQESDWSFTGCCGLLPLRLQSLQSTMVVSQQADGQQYFQYLQWMLQNLQLHFKCIRTAQLPSSLKHSALLWLLAFETQLGQHVQSLRLLLQVALKALSLLERKISVSALKTYRKILGNYSVCDFFLKQ